MEEKIDLILKLLENSINLEIQQMVYNDLMADLQNHRDTHSTEAAYPELEETDTEIRKLWESRLQLSNDISEILTKGKGF